MAGLGFCETTEVLVLDAAAAGDLVALALPTVCGAGLAACFAGVHFLCQCDFGAGLAVALITGWLTCFGAGNGFTGSRTTSAAGFTPADIAARVAAAERTGAGATPRKSGFTTICRADS